MLRLAADQHTSDTVPATLRTLSEEVQALHRHRRSRDWYPTERPSEQAADSLNVLDVELHIKHVLDIIDRDHHMHAHAAVVERLDPGRLPVVLIGDLTDDLLEDVLDRHQPSGAAVLVDDDRNVDLLGLHLSEQLVDRFGLRDEVSRAHDLFDLLGPVLVLVDPARKVLEIGHTEYVVLVLTHDRYAGEPAAQCERQPLPHRLATLDPDHVRSRDHDFASQGV